MKIQEITVDISKHYLDPVTYVPLHAYGNASHKDAQKGVIIRRNEKYIFVLFCNSRTIQVVDPENLLWG